MSLESKDVFYVETYGGREHWWTFSDGLKVHLNAEWARKAARRTQYVRTVVVK